LIERKAKSVKNFLIFLRIFFFSFEVNIFGLEYFGEVCHSLESKGQLLDFVFGLRAALPIPYIGSKK